MLDKQDLKNTTGEQTGEQQANKICFLEARVTPP